MQKTSCPLFAVVLVAALWLCCAACASYGDALHEPADRTMTFTVAASSERILVHLSREDGRVYKIAELSPWQSQPHPGLYLVCWEGVSDGRVIAIPRFAGDRDRLYARFQLVDALTDEPIGQAQWVSNLDAMPAAEPPIPWDEGIKGISCPVITIANDIRDLGARFVTTNVYLHGLFDLAATSPTAVWTVDGQDFPLNLTYIQALDREVKTWTSMGANVHMVLNNPGRGLTRADSPFIHPDSEFGEHSMGLGAFNLTDEAGYRAYRAAMEFMAHRYSRPDGRYGWIGGYIVGNEIQQHWAWWNMGQSPADKVMDHYHRALRVAWLAVRSHAATARVYISMDQHWAQTGHMNDPLKEIPGRLVLERLTDLSRRQGDFPWHVAFHPYPQNLFEPRFWRDTQATLSFDTPKITFHNIEVLPAFLRRPEMLCDGKPRRIALTEQGFHRPDGDDGEAIQAAAYAAAWYKVSRLDGIDAFMLHRHVSHRGEGGLRLGIWTNDADSPSPSAPGRKKQIWEVVRMADTTQWRDAFAFALPIIGIQDWSELRPGQVTE